VDRITGKSFATRSEVIARQGMVATSQPLATQAGLEVLQRGGGAVDAAIAANAALGVMEPTGCGLGGDLFAIVWSARDRRLHGLNGSGRAPLGATLEQMRAAVAKLGRDTIPPYGLLPVTVPGCVDGWFELHGRFGRLPLSQVLAPAIRHAQEGFPVSEVIAFAWERNGPLLREQPGGFATTFLPGGRAPGTGALFRNPDLARTLMELTADRGREAFYRGPIADRIDAFMREHGGFLRREDLAAHTSTWVEPVSVNYRGFDVYELPPNGQGVAALQILNLLEGFDLRGMGLGSPDALHLMIEAKKLAFEDRARFYADPAFHPAPLEWLLSKEYAAQRRALIDPARAARRVAAGEPPAPADTVYLCTADAEGTMVSLIQSNYRGMGSGIVVPGLGFGLQDRGEQFSLDSRHPNAFAPGKRPFHTIIPAFVMKQGEPWLAFGVMGGAMQPQGHVQILVNLIDYGLNVQEAGDAPRWQHEGSTEPTGAPDAALHTGGYVLLETGFPWETVRELKLRGHDVRTDVGGFGGYQAIRRDPATGVYFGASESRKDGQAAGF
jgi:gamma-glutamyltranspeptidase/glutathione hydrolase